MEQTSRIVTFSLLLIATIFCSVALFIPWAGYTIPITGQFLAAEKYVYSVYSGMAYPLGETQSKNVEWESLAIFIAFILPLILKIITPILGFSAVVLALSKRETYVFACAAFAGATALLSIITYYLFIFTRAPQYIVLDGLYANLIWSPGFYLFAIVTILYFAGAGMIVYFPGSELKTGFIKEKISSPGDDAIKILNLRYAKGEITKEEYEQMKKDISD